jgi:hypothetical protein
MKTKILITGSVLFGTVGRQKKIKIARMWSVVQSNSVLVYRDKVVIFL